MLKMDTQKLPKFLNQEVNLVEPTKPLSPVRPGGGGTGALKQVERLAR